jgi:hypothetical protein
LEEKVEIGSFSLGHQTSGFEIKALIPIDVAVLGEVEQIKEGEN